MLKQTLHCCWRLLALSLLTSISSAAEFSIHQAQFHLNNEPFFIRSGEMHYPRIPREYWSQRLKMAKAMGLNTITTYVFWNAHEAQEGHFDFSGNLDLAAFIKLAQAEGLYVILRPGPYICTEWDLGGIPAWLLQKSDSKIRSNDQRFLSAAESYLKEIATQTKSLFISHGGPIIMVQVENEYGSYPYEEGYKENILAAYQRAGFTDVQLFTSDGPDNELLRHGTQSSLAASVNFFAGPDFEESIDVLKQFRPDTPAMIGEWWSGWFDHWGREHHTTPALELASGVSKAIQQNIHFNLYMFHGGSNFGFNAGANWDGRYWPDTSSYDYDSPLDEAGRPTEKFHLVRAAIQQQLPRLALPPVPPSPKTQAIPRIVLNQQAPLWQLLKSPMTMENVSYMESWKQTHGFVLYRHRAKSSVRDVLDIGEARDFVTLFSAGKNRGTLDRRLGQHAIDLTIQAGQTLDLFVEAMGHINFGAKLADDRKGLLQSVTLAGEELHDWQVFALPLDDLNGLAFSTKPSNGPTFFRGQFNVNETLDTFLDLRGWEKGLVWVNGHNLGRYWSIGPQQNLYLPGVWLKKGQNEIVVLETQKAQRNYLQGLKNPIYN